MADGSGTELLVRNCVQGDYPAMERMHASMGLDYRLPSLASPLWVVQKIACVGQRPVAACGLRLTAEAYLLFAPGTMPREKMDAMRRLQPAALDAAWDLGIDEVECRIPQETERRFEKRLLELGWSRDRADWWPWSRPTARAAGE